MKPTKKQLTKAFKILKDKKVTFPFIVTLKSTKGETKVLFNKDGTYEFRDNK